jgi:HEAT repeat protein
MARVSKSFLLALAVAICVIVVLFFAFSYSRPSQQVIPRSVHTDANSKPLVIVFDQPLSQPGTAVQGANSATLESKTEIVGKFPDTNSVALAPTVAAVPKAYDSDIANAAIRSLVEPKDPFSAQDRLQTLNALLDANTPAKARYQAAWKLAEYADASTIEALSRVLSDPLSPATLKAAILEGLGSSEYPQKKDVLLQWLSDKDEVVVCGAIRGLSAIGDEDSVSMLANMARSTDSSTVATEALNGLGTAHHPSAMANLVQMYNEPAANRAELTREDILAAIGNRNISESGQFLAQVFNDNAADSEIRCAVAEAVGDSKGNVGAFLVSTLSDPCSDVRAAAAWSLASAEEPGDVASEIQGLIKTEPDSTVRMRLYQALNNQENVDISALASNIASELVAETQLAGYNFLSRNIRGTDDQQLKQWYATTVVPELKNTALTGEASNTRLTAVMALKAAGLPESRTALQDIARQTTDKKVLQAIPATLKVQKQ